jgi:hypothetical protein
MLIHVTYWGAEIDLRMTGERRKIGWRKDSREQVKRQSREEI